MTIRICVTGGRDYRDDAVIHGALDYLHKLHGIASLAHGNNPGKADVLFGPVIPGADLRAQAWAEAHGVAVVKYPVTGDQWRDQGKSAGPRRNGFMLATEDPDMLVRFKGGRGTADCERQARKAGIYVHRVAP